MSFNEAYSVFPLTAELVLAVLCERPLLSVYVTAVLLSKPPTTLVQKKASRSGLVSAGRAKSPGCVLVLPGTDQSRCVNTSAMVRMLLRRQLGVSVPGVSWKPAKGSVQFL